MSQHYAALRIFKNLYDFFYWSAWKSDKYKKKLNKYNRFLILISSEWIEIEIIKIESFELLSMVHMNLFFKNKDLQFHVSF